MFGRRGSGGRWQPAFWLQAAVVLVGLNLGCKMQREDRDLGVIQPDGTVLEIKIKELTDAEKHKGQRKIVCLTR